MMFLAGRGAKKRPPSGSGVVTGCARAPRRGHEGGDIGLSTWYSASDENGSALGSGGAAPERTPPGGPRARVRTQVAGEGFHAVVGADRTRRVLGPVDAISTGAAARLSRYAAPRGARHAGYACRGGRLTGRRCLPDAPHEHGRVPPLVRAAALAGRCRRSPGAGGRRRRRGSRAVAGRTRGRHPPGSVAHRVPRARSAPVRSAGARISACVTAGLLAPPGRRPCSTAEVREQSAWHGPR